MPKARPAQAARPRSGLIVHEWIEPTGGAERVVDEMVRVFPDADLYCLWNDDPGRYQDRRVVESWLARTPLRRFKPLAAAAAPVVWCNMRPGSADGYPWILVSSHLFAHQARLRGAPDVPKFVYVHTPARYLWAPSLDTRGARGAVRLVAPLFRRVDRARANEPNQLYAANSHFIKERIRQSWDVEARVIYPPVDVARGLSGRDWAGQLDEAESAILKSLPEEFLLGASRFVPYKRLDAVIAAGRASRMPVVIAGRGPEEAALRALAARSGVDVRFVVSPSDDLLSALFQRASVYVFPPVEDFGIMPVEAMAFGTPVVANALGGASESVLDGSTGILVKSFSSPSEVRAAVDAARSLEPARARQRARDFAPERFADELRAWLPS